MFSPHHVEALLHERQSELLQSADRVRQGRLARRRRVGRPGGGRRLPVRLAAAIRPLARPWPRRRRSPAPSPAPATADTADASPPGSPPVPAAPAVRNPRRADVPHAA